LNDIVKNLKKLGKVGGNLDIVGKPSMTRIFGR
jgi:hypothetical protein